MDSVDVPRPARRCADRVGARSGDGRTRAAGAIAAPRTAGRSMTREPALQAYGANRAGRLRASPSAMRTLIGTAPGPGAIWSAFALNHFTHGQTGPAREQREAAVLVVSVMFLQARIRSSPTMLRHRCSCAHGRETEIDTGRDAPLRGLGGNPFHRRRRMRAPSGSNAASNVTTPQARCPAMSMVTGCSRTPAGPPASIIANATGFPMR